MKVVEAINATHSDVIIGGGDLITDGFTSDLRSAAPRWDVYMGMHRGITGEHHTVIGNHDLVGVRPSDGSSPAADPRSAYKQRLGLSQTFYAFDALGYRIILLDSVRISGDEHGYHGWVAQEQQEWLKELLSRTSREMPIVLALHIPLVTAFFGATQGDHTTVRPNRVVVNNVDVLEIFAEHNLVLVLQGHLHISEYLRLNNTTFITGGAVSGGWWRGPYHGTGEGFNVVTLHSDRVKWEYVAYR